MNDKSWLPKMKIDQEVLDWLLEPSQPVIRYYTLLDLLCRSKDDEDVRKSYSEIPRRGWAAEILEAQKPRGYWESRKDLYRPKYTSTNWRTIVLADFGLTTKNRRVRLACELFFKDWLGQKDNVVDDGEVCVVGNLARTLTRCGYGDDPRVKRMFDWLVEDQKEDGGWHCFRSNKGTLDCWEALSAFNALPRRMWTKRIKKSAEQGAEFYLERELYKEGRRYAPWFRFHYPIHYYYDILVGLDTITALGYGNDKRLRYALNLLEEKRLPNGRWALDAVHPDLAPGAKYRLRKPPPIPFVLEEVGKPSKWITLTALRVLTRIA